MNATQKRFRAISKQLRAPRNERERQVNQFFAQEALELLAKRQCAYCGEGEFLNASGVCQDCAGQGAL